MKILVVYGTTEGHARKIAHRLADWITIRGHEVAIVDASDVPDELEGKGFGICFAVGSVHMERHQTSLVHFIKEHLDWFQTKPSALISVSLNAALEDADSQATARSYIGSLIEHTGWLPLASLPVAGALMYTHYDFFKKFILRVVAQKQGGPVDTSKDFDFTDYERLASFVDEFMVQHEGGSPTEA